MMITVEQAEYVFKDVPNEVKKLVALILIELKGAEDKHPIWVTDKGGSQVDAAGVVCEEAGELIRAALNFTYEGGRMYDMHEEALQTAAMCIRFLRNAPGLFDDKKEEVSND